jgi:tRNA(Ile)-lysidine synthase
MDWLAKFRSSLESGQLLCGVKRLLVGVSGGPDSTALFLLFAELKETGWVQPFPEVFVGHVHHGLRGADADEDERFVSDLSAARGMECLVFKGNALEEGRRSGASPEEAARALRYRAFRFWAVERSLDAVALAHHIEDQAETILYRMARGTGIGGLAGIPSTRPLFRKGPRSRLIRPLLSWHRDSLLRYLSERGQPYRLDRSNQDGAIPRNLIRHQVLPLLERRVHPGAVRSLSRLGEIARGFARDLRALGEAAFRESRVAETGESVLLALEALKRWPPSVVCEAIKLAVERVGSKEAGEGNPTVSARAFQRVLEWIREGPKDRRLSLGSLGPGGEPLSLELRYGHIRVGTRGESRASPVNEVVFSGSPPGASGWGWKFQLDQALLPRSFDPRRERDEGDDACFEEHFDGEALEAAGPLKVRCRRPGDRFWPLGSPGRKKLKEFFRESRVWPSERDSVPLLVAGETIAWVVGRRMDHRFRVTAGTRRAVVLRATRATSPPGSMV